MRIRLPDDNSALDPALLAPLFSVQRALEHSGFVSDRFFEPFDFVYMGTVLRSGRPDVHLFKHFYTCRFLYLDDDGISYRFLSPRHDAHPSYTGSYRPHPDLRPAIDKLDLWEMPWMKPGLEDYRCGMPWSERWSLWDHETGDLRLWPEPEGRDDW
jgi:hypothetical protein